MPVPAFKVPVWPLLPLIFQVLLLALSTPATPETPLLVRVKPFMFSTPPFALNELPVFTKAFMVTVPLVSVNVLPPVPTDTGPFKAIVLPVLLMVKFCRLSVPEMVALFTVPVSVIEPPIGVNVPL